MGLLTEPLDPKVIAKFKGKSNSGLTTSLFYLMKELHISYFDLMNMPLPSIIVLLEELNSHTDRELKANKQASRKR